MLKQNEDVEAWVFDGEYDGVEDGCRVCYISFAGIVDETVFSVVAVLF